MLMLAQANGRDSTDGVSTNWVEATWEAKTPFLEKGEIRYLSIEELAAVSAPFFPPDAGSETRPGDDK